MNDTTNGNWSTIHTGNSSIINNPVNSSVNLSNVTSSLLVKNNSNYHLMLNSTVLPTSQAFNTSLASHSPNISVTEPLNLTPLSDRLNTTLPSVVNRVVNKTLANFTTQLAPKADNSPLVTTVPSIQVGKNLTNYANLTSSLAMEQPDLESSTSGLSVIFIGLFSIIVCAAIIFLIVILVRKNRLDKLRHHLMPVYNFDPSEDGEDWETELLEEPFGSQSYGNDNKMNSIKLDSGLTGGLNLKGNNYSNGSSGSKSRPTAASGLLSDNNNGNHSSRYLYTNEKPVV